MPHNKQCQRIQTACHARIHTNLKHELRVLCGGNDAEKIANQKPHLNYNLIPNVIYTWPEVASVGKTQFELENEGIEIKIGQFPMRALGRARASMDVDGFVKILADKNTDEVLGVHMIGARVADLIAEAVTAMEFRASAEDISRMSHSHPTYAEAIKEAALSVDKRQIHS